MLASSGHVNYVGLMGIGYCHARFTLYPLSTLDKALGSDPTPSNVLGALWPLALGMKATCSAARQNGQQLDPKLPKHFAFPTLRCCHWMTHPTQSGANFGWDGRLHIFPAPPWCRVACML